MKGQVSLRLTLHVPTEVACAHVTLGKSVSSHTVGSDGCSSLSDSLIYHLPTSEHIAEAILTSEHPSEFHMAFEDRPDRNPGFKEITS